MTVTQVPEPEAIASKYFWIFNILSTKNKHIPSKWAIKTMNKSNLKPSEQIFLFVFYNAPISEGTKVGSMMYFNLQIFIDYFKEFFKESHGKSLATEFNFFKLRIFNPSVGSITTSYNLLSYLFWGAPKSLQTVTAAMKLKSTCSLEGKLWKT